MQQLIMQLYLPLPYAALKSLVWAQTVKIRIESLPRYDRLMDRTWRAEESFCDERGRPCYRDFQMSHNAVIAYVRHQCTNYEQLLSEIEDSPCYNEAHDILQYRINRQIEAALRY